MNSSAWLPQSKGTKSRFSTTSHCYLLCGTELTSEPLEGTASTSPSPPSSTHSVGKPYKPQRYQRWHQSSWHREWRLPAGGNAQSSPPSLCVCSKEKRRVSVTGGAAQVIACPLLLDADCKGRKQPGFMQKRCVCVGEVSRVQKVFANAALKCGYGFGRQKHSRETPSSPPTGEQL